jgi:hypothetical protein
LFWTLGVKDIGLVHDTFKRFPTLPQSTALFLTGDASHLPAVDKEKLGEVGASGAKAEERRIRADDLADLDVEEWYLCTSPGLRKMIQEWLPGKKTIYEKFDY